MRLLVEPAVRDQVRGWSEITKRILEQIFRFGLEQDSEQSRILFYLYDFDRALLQQPTVLARLAPTVEHIYRGAEQVTSSNVTESIDALLLAPMLSRETGVRLALSSLSHLLDVGARAPAIAFSHAYNSVLLVVDQRGALREQFTAAAEYDRLEVDLLDRMARLWEAARERPLLFAPFALPPKTKPDPIVVHNWAFASLRLASTVGVAPKIEAALRAASGNPELSGAIALARAARATTVQHPGRGSRGSPCG